MPVRPQPMPQSMRPISIYACFLPRDSAKRPGAASELICRLHEYIEAGPTPSPLFVGVDEIPLPQRENAAPVGAAFRYCRWGWGLRAFIQVNSRLPPVCRAVAS